MTLASHISAPNVHDTVAPFRAWRSSRLVVARGPTRATIEIAYVLQIMDLSKELRPDFSTKRIVTEAKCGVFVELANLYEV